MCDFVSVIATTEGSLQLYAAPGLFSHGDAREGWNIVSGAEVEWVGEYYESLTVRHEDKRIRDTILRMIKDKYPTRTDLINSITETRGTDSSKLYYKNGKVVYCEETHGPNYKEIEKLIQDLPNFPWFKPVEKLDKNKIIELVQEHISALGKYGYKRNKISVKFMQNRDEHLTILHRPRNIKWSAACSTVEDSLRGNRVGDIHYNSTKCVVRHDVMHAIRDVPYFAVVAFVCNASCLFNDVENPFKPLVEIYRLGCVPIGVLGYKFCVYIPPTKNTE